MLEIMRAYDRVVDELDEECDHLYYGRIYSFYPNDRIKADPITKQYDSQFKMATHLEKVLAMLDTMQAKVERAGKDEVEKSKLLERLDMMRLTPYYILAFYRDYLYKEEKFATKYFSSSKVAFEESAKRFFDLCEKLHVFEMGEAKKPAWHKELLGVQE